MDRSSFLRKTTMVLDLFFLLRPTVLIPVWTILLMAYITTVPLVPFRNNTPPPHYLLMMILFTLLLGAIYVVNQVVDKKSDSINNKLFILPQGLVSAPIALLFAGLLTTVSLYGVFTHFSVEIGTIFVVAMALGILYNSAPFNLRSRPIGGLIANVLGHGVLTYFVGWIILYQPNSSREYGYGLFLALASGFANGAVYLTSTIPDIKGDAMVNKKTFSVVFGVNRTSYVAFIFVLLSLAFSFFLSYNSWVFIVPALLSSLLFYRLLRNPGVKSSSTFVLPVALLGLFVAVFVPLYSGVVIVVVAMSRVYYKKRFNYTYPSL